MGGDTNYLPTHFTRLLEMWGELDVKLKAKRVAPGNV